MNFRPSTLSGTPTEMTASMGSSTHVFFPPRVQLKIHVAQTSMWLLDVSSPRSEAQCRGGDRQGAFNRTQRIVMSVLALGVSMVFSQPLEILSWLVLSALMDPQRRLDWLGGKDRRLGFDSVRKPIACLGWQSLYTCEVVLADCSREHFAGDETNKQLLVLVCGEASEWAQSTGSG